MKTKSEIFGDINDHAYGLVKHVYDLVGDAVDFKTQLPLKIYARHKDFKGEWKLFCAFGEYIAANDYCVILSEALSVRMVGDNFEKRY